MSERRVLWYGAFLTGVAVLWLCGACAFPEQKYVRGALIRIEHRQDFEAPCPIFGKLKYAEICDTPPVCCAYRVTVKDSTGHTERFYAFWPRGVPGLEGLVALGSIATFHLHRRTIVEYPCSMYGCPGHMDYALDGDEDVKP